MFVFLELRRVRTVCLGEIISNDLEHFISNDLEHLSVLHMQLCVNKLCNRMDRDNTDSRDGGV